MYDYQKVWDISKLRFHQNQSHYWTVSNRLLDALLIIGLAVWAYLEFFSDGDHTIIQNLALVIFLGSLGTAWSRRSQAEGYIDGYEQGFIDATSKNLDFWDDAEEALYDVKIDEVLQQIEVNETQITPEDLRDRTAQIDRGVLKAVGWGYYLVKFQDRKYRINP